MEIWLASLISSVSTMALISILVFLSKTWISDRIQYSIKHEYDQKLSQIEHDYAQKLSQIDHEYDRKLSQIEHDRKVRLKAELVAELLSEWINKNDDKQRLNELTFKAFLWLPPEIASELSDTLSNKKDAPNIRIIIDKVRKHFLGENDSLKHQQVIVFPVE
ncbi:hypothetical protein [Agarivorans gilvus]|uniref:DUF2489 domain-containing protein n=1 Tax=Agarivorans gilvus TaxID=680279 RepID=A0ABQ1HZD8_9ALTE|nr:hypothetical protein [Agarivorans gilvus]GGA95721.1 hypothetical protein GCM10007414_05660 [Agarivorans gilvus]